MKLGKILLLFVFFSSSCVFAGSMGPDSWQPSPWLLRLRVIEVAPYPSSNRVNNVGGHFDEMSKQVVPEFDISYFFAEHVAAEAIFGTMRHHIGANGTSAGHVDLGRVALLPPTVTLQYHFSPAKRYKPYVGLGINFTHFYHVTRGSVSISSFYSDSFGPALQAGIDIAIKPKWFINLDVKKIFIQSNAYITTTQGQFNPTVKVNPIISGIGIGYRG